MTDYNDGKWHGWNGGECPVHPETVIDGVYMIGDKIAILNSSSDCFVWQPNEYMTIAFRVIKEHKEPREFWVYNGNAFPFDAYPDAIHVREVLP